MHDVQAAYPGVNCNDSYHVTDGSTVYDSLPVIYHCVLCFVTYVYGTMVLLHRFMFAVTSLFQVHIFSNSKHC